MKIDESIYGTYLSGIAQTQLQPVNPSNGKTAGAGEDGGDRDSYIPGIADSDIPIPTSTYNANGMMVDDFRPVTNVNTDQQASTASSFLDQLSETFRANTNSILSTLETLGLTLGDLSDKDNLTALANAMNEGAQSLGVPTVDDLDNAVESLYNTISGASGTSESAAASEDSAEAAGGAGGGSGSGEDEDETTTEVVTINGVTYLETTTTQNGITTTTRTRIGGVAEA